MSPQKPEVLSPEAGVWFGDGPPSTDVDPDDEGPQLQGDEVIPKPRKLQSSKCDTNQDGRTWLPTTCRGTQTVHDREKGEVMWGSRHLCWAQHTNLQTYSTAHTHAYHIDFSSPPFSYQRSGCTCSHGQFHTLHSPSCSSISRSYKMHTHFIPFICYVLWCDCLSCPLGVGLPVFQDILCVIVWFYVCLCQRKDLSVL